MGTTILAVAKTDNLCFKESHTNMGLHTHNFYPNFTTISRNWRSDFATFQSLETFKS